MADGFVKTVKFAMFIANGIILIGGTVVFSIGIWTLLDKSFMERLLGTKSYIASASILICSGLVVAVISLLGSLGAWRENRCLLIIFFCILLIIFLAMLTGGILGYIFRAEVDVRMHTEMVNTISIYGNDSKVTRTWDDVQENFACCGVVPQIGAKVYPYRIWLKNKKFSMRKAQVPESCCINQTDKKMLRQCTGKRLSIKAIFIDDCYRKMKDFVKSHALIVGGIGIGIAVLLIFGMILSCVLFLLIG